MNPLGTVVLLVCVIIIILILSKQIPNLIDRTRLFIVIIIEEILKHNRSNLEIVNVIGIVLGFVSLLIALFLERGPSFLKQVVGVDNDQYCTPTITIMCVVLFAIAIILSPMIIFRYNRQQELDKRANEKLMIDKGH